MWTAVFDDGTEHDTGVADMDDASQAAERNGAIDLAAAAVHRGGQNCCGTFWLEVLASAEAR